MYINSCLRYLTPQRVTKIGFSREIAKLIESKGKAMFVDGRIIINTKIFEVDNEQLLSELNDVKLNYAELFLEH